MTERLPPETVRRDWHRDQLMRAAVAVLVVGSSAWVGYNMAAAQYVGDAAKWRQVLAAYRVAPEVGDATLRNLAESE